MRKLFISLAAVLTLSLSSAGPAMAFDPIGVPCSSAAGSMSSLCVKPADRNPIATTVSKIALIVAYVAGIVAFITIMVAGLNIMTSRGDASGVAKGRSTLISTSVGLIIITLASAIVHFIINRIIQ